MCCRARLPRLATRQPRAAAHRPVARAGAGRCTSRPDGAVLGTAIVVYGRKAGISAWGHASVRFLACEGGRLVDEEVEIEIALVKRSGRRVRYETVVRKVACGTVCVDGFALALLPE